MTAPLTFDGPDAGPRDHILVLTHGAGASSSHPSMTELARLIGERGVSVARFDFPYMRRAAATGQRAWPPDDEDVLVGAWVEVLRELAPAGRLIIGGRSLGGRVASILADAAEVAALVCVSYPFHPPNRESPVRTAHLRVIETPTLIVQGERDPYGTRQEVAQYQLSPKIGLHWIPDGDHGLIPRKRSGLTEADNLANAAAAIADFVHSLQR